VASHAYSIGDLAVPTAPTAGHRYVWRCTTAGTSSTEPTWSGAYNNNATIASGGATFTNVTGQSAYFWTAAAGDVLSLNALSATPRLVAGERCYISSDHSETQSSGNFGSGNNQTAGWGVIQYLCVNRAGSTPPAIGDLTTGAAIIFSGANMVLDTQIDVYHYGITFSSTGGTIQIGSAGFKTIYLDNCQLYLNNVTAGSRIGTGNTSGTLVLNNSTLRFGSASQAIGSITYPFDLVWMGTPGAIAGATVPTTLFNPGGNSVLQVTCRGVDLSAVTGTLISSNAAGAGLKALLDSCRIASGVTRYALNTTTNTRDVMELVNCYDGTNIISERYTPGGNVFTERTITLTGGATDDVGTFSHRLVSNANADKFVFPLEGFWLDVENTLAGSSHTATVEIASSAALNNDEIALLLEYQGTSGSPVASFATSFVGPVTAPAAVPTSAAAWNSLPATPVRQHLQVAFTAQQAGRLRGQVRLGRPSTTVYVDPRITVT
jgi:hypothetical protein